MATIDDIAKRAKVSNTTVSNVINGRAKRVSKTTIDRINQIIAEVGYVPNMSARALVSRSSKVVALINYSRTGKTGEFLDDPFLSRFASSIENALRENGYFLMMRTVTSGDDLLSYINKWGVDGVFLTGVFETDEIYKTLFSITKPIVLCDSYLPDYGRMANVGAQDAEGGRLATRYLIKAGHRRIAFAGAPIRSGGVVEERLNGYKAALDESGIAFDNSIVFQSEFPTNDSMTLGGVIAKRSDITAVFATADILAAGVMAGIRAAGKSVPGDYSVVGFDDLNWCRLISPPLTTVRQNTRLKGQLAADLMVSMLEEGSETARNITLPVHIVERESVRTISS